MTQKMIHYCCCVSVVKNVEFAHQQMHFFILKNTLKFTLKYT